MCVTAQSHPKFRYKVSCPSPELQVYDNKLEELALEAALDFAMSSTQ